MTGWFPISTAPKDGTEIDVWAAWSDTGEGERIPDASWGRFWSIDNIHDEEPTEGWGAKNLGYDGCDGLIDNRNVTHWMPKPSAP